ncbi:CPBP family intramembrane metalloprotease [bacterium]|nr:CPBP family intramembrane metalloprotease [bacterium]
MALAGLALAPAFLEEVLFRGLLQGAARRRFGSGAAILLSGVLFGLFHLDLYRWPTLALIGLLLAWVAESGGSLWPSVATHLVNNTLALVLVNCASGTEQAWVDSMEDVPAPWLAVGAGCLLAGGFLVRRAGRPGQSAGDASSAPG